MMGFKPLQVVFKRADIRVNLGTASRVNKVFATAFVNVPRRKNAEDAIAGFGLKDSYQVSDLMQ
jgi:hypothetical protein